MINRYRVSEPIRVDILRRSLKQIWKSRVSLLNREIVLFQTNNHWSKTIQNQKTLEFFTNKFTTKKDNGHKVMNSMALKYINFSQESHLSAIPWMKTTKERRILKNT